jgi:hypothetical protein
VNRIIPCRRILNISYAFYLAVRWLLGDTTWMAVKKEKHKYCWENKKWTACVLRVTKKRKQIVYKQEHKKINNSEMNCVWYESQGQQTVNDWPVKSRGGLLVHIATSVRNHFTVPQLALCFVSGRSRVPSLVRKSQKDFVVFFTPSRKMIGQWIKIVHDYFPPHLSFIIILPFYVCSLKSID